MNTATQSTEGFSCIFIHSSLDDAKLTASEFRVFAHISRRASDGSSWSSADDMARVCRLKSDTIWSALKELEARSMLSRESRKGMTTRWSILPPNRWLLSPTAGTKPETGGAPPNGVPPAPPNGVQRRSKKEIHKGKKDSTIHRFTELVPESLKAVGFCEAWCDWVEYRAEIKKKMTEKTVTAQLSKLAKFGPSIAVKAIRTSIENGWQGLFPESVSNPRRGVMPPSRGLPGAPVNAEPVTTDDDGSRLLTEAEIQETMRQAAEAEGIK